MAFLLCTATIVTCLTKPIVPNDESITDLATLFPEYTEVTGVSALHSLDVWCQADSAQLEDFLALLELWFSMEPETVHFTETSPSKRAGDTLYRIELGEKTAKCT